MVFHEGLLEELISFAPRLAGAVIILVIGWAVGRGLGKGISRVLDKAGVDDALRRTPVGRAIEKAGVSLVHFFDLIVRWFVYLIAILAAVNVLEITVLSNFMNTVVTYLPSFIAGLFILLIGFIVADFVGDAITQVGREAHIEYHAILSTIVRFTLYFVVLLIGLSTMRIDVTILNIFATAIAWGIAGAIALGIGLAVGLGLKDVIAKRAEDWFKKASETVKEVETVAEKELEKEKQQ